MQEVRVPIYEYLCNGCARIFSVITLKASGGETACPECGSKDVTKQISMFSCGVSSGAFSSGGG